MANLDSYIIIGIGVLFLFLGLIIMLWAKQKAKGYGDVLSRREELRSFLGYWPEFILPRELRAGGWVSIFIGAALIILGIVLLFWV
jgi:uncharacterized membrane protein